jgi:hypothetical protein
MQTHQTFPETADDEQLPVDTRTPMPLPSRVGRRPLTVSLVAALSVVLVAAAFGSFAWRRTSSQRDALATGLRDTKTSLIHLRRDLASTRGQLGFSQTARAEAETQQRAAEQQYSKLRAEVVGTFAAAMRRGDASLSPAQWRCVAGKLLDKWGFTKWATLQQQTQVGVAQQREVLAVVGLCMSADANA